MEYKTAKEKISELTRKINYHNKRYYLHDKPEISDGEFGLVYAIATLVSSFLFINFAPFKEILSGKTLLIASNIDKS